jgi:hypothetical protein
MHPPKPIAHRVTAWRGKALLRFLLLLAAAAAIAALAAHFGIAYDYGYLRASILTGVPDGQYHITAMRLAERAKRERGSLTVDSTQGSVENVSRLIADRTRCRETFALVQDGTPVPRDARLELLGRLPEPESLLLFGKRDRTFGALANLRGTSIGIGPEGSGTAHLMRLLFEDPDLQSLNARLSNHGYVEQAELVARGELDLAAVVMADDSPLLRAVIRDYDLDLVAPHDSKVWYRAIAGWVSAASLRGASIWCVPRPHRTSRWRTLPPWSGPARALTAPSASPFSCCWPPSFPASFAAILRDPTAPQPHCRWRPKRASTLRPESPISSIYTSPGWSISCHRHTGSTW